MVQFVHVILLRQSGQWVQRGPRDNGDKIDPLSPLAKGTGTGDKVVKVDKRQRGQGDKRVQFVPFVFFGMDGKGDKGKVLGHLPHCQFEAFESFVREYKMSSLSRQHLSTFFSWSSLLPLTKGTNWSLCPH